MIMTYCKFFICESQSVFNTKLSSGAVNQADLVFIQDTKQLWTHGVMYSCPYSEEEIEELFKASEEKLTGLIDGLKATATTSKDGLMSASDKTKLDNLVAKGGEPNQNAYAKIKSGSTTIEADAVSDTFEIAAGSNITITPDTTNDKITIAATDTTYDPATSSKFGVVKIGTSAAKANGTASAGTATGGLAAAVDHVHPLQTSVSGNAGTATKLASKVSIAVSGAVTGSVDFDGSTGATIATTLSDIDASKITSGTISIDRLPKGALERLVTVADDTARYKLTTNDVQLGDTVKVTSTGLMYYVVDTSKLNSAAGYSEYTAGTATSVPWGGVTGKPTEFTPEDHTHTKSEITDFPTSMKNPNSLTIKLNGTSQGAYDGSSTKSIDITPASIGASAEGHAHLYAASSTEGGSALSAEKLNTNAGSATKPVYFKDGKPVECTSIEANASSATTAATADKVANSMTLQIASGTTEGTNKYTFNGSAAKSLNIVAGDNVTLTAASGKLTISSTDTNTTYDANNGITLSGTTFGLTSGVVTAGSAGPTGAVTGNDGATISVPRVTVDTYGRVTALTAQTLTLKNTDTTYTAGTGLDLNGTAFSLEASGVTAGNYGPSSAVTGDDGSTMNVPYITVDTYGRVTSITNKTYTARNTTYSAATTSANGLMSSDDKTKLDNLGGIINISKTMTVGTSWLDTGILTTSLGGSGTYVVQIYLNNSKTAGAYQGYWSGIMSVYAGNSTETTEDEIVLHCNSQSNGAQLYLRTKRQSSAATKLQISSSVSIASTTYVFKFRKLI